MMRYLYVRTIEITITLYSFQGYLHTRQMKMGSLLCYRKRGVSDKLELKGHNLRHLLQILTRPIGEENIYLSG